jgi:beta-phosphoglucomutase family hydrolase
MIAPRAFLFDLNGTMIDDMAYHLDVWYNLITNDFGARMTREEVKHHMYGKSQEVLLRIFGRERFTNEALDRISFDKERLYQQLYRPHLDLIPGLFAFLDKTRDEKIKMAIGSAAMPFNIDFVIDNLKIRHYFDAIVSADDVQKSKPDPETYLKAARMLNVDPESCIVFEDAPKGVECAKNAGMKSVVLTTTHPKDDFNGYDNIILFADDYTQLTPGFLQQRLSTVCTTV